MVTQQYLFDGTKHVALHSLDTWGWSNGADWHGGDEPTLSVMQAYHLVPYLHGAVERRARGVASLPWALYRLDEPAGAAQDVKNDPSFTGIVRGMRQRLYRTEATLCLYGMAYWVKETNRAGRNLTPRWVVPTSINPHFDLVRGLTGYVRSAGTVTQELSPDQVVAFWVPNLVSEMGPGTAPAQVALSAARLLYNLDLFADGFFRRGAIKATLLTVEGNPSKAELERLESWWRRLLTGVRQAWQSIAIRSSVKPVTIGDGLADVQSRELTKQQRENICAALGVPHSLLSADAANYATSRQDKLNFLLDTILPEAALIEETLNDQLFTSLGVRFVFQTEQLEEMQQYEVEKAQALSALVDGPVMTVREARRMLGLADVPLPFAPDGAERKEA